MHDVHLFFFAITNGLSLALFNYYCLVKNYSLLILILLSTLLGCKTKKIENRFIKLNLSVTRDYCGGAYPTAEIVAELRAAKPYNGLIYLHRSENRTDNVITLDVKDGKCLVNGLADGKYYIFIAPLMQPPQNLPFTKEAIVKLECQLKHNRTPNVSFSIDKKTSKVVQNIHVVCDPCELPMP